MSNGKTRRSPLRFVFGLLLVLIVAAGAFSLLLWRSANELYEHADAAEASFQTSMEQLSARDYRAALVSARTTAADISLIQEGLQGWQWQIAARIPVLADDVSCARACSNIAGTLANEALLPLLDQTEGLVALTESAASPQLIGDTLSKLTELYQTAKEARGVVATCATQVQELPTSHFARINEMVTVVRDAASQADDAFASLDLLFQAVDTLGGLAGMLGDLATQTPAA